MQGCCEESYHALDPGLEAAGLSAIAGLAGGVAGILGAGVGSVLATHPMDPSLWDDAPPSDRPVVTADPIPEGPTRPTTIVLEGRRRPRHTGRVAEGQRRWWPGRSRSA